MMMKFESLVGLGLLLSSIHAFMPSPNGVAKNKVNNNYWKLGAVIRASDIDRALDLGEGGVRLAEESAIKISGPIKHKLGKVECEPTGLVRYNNLKKVEEGAAIAVLNKVGAKILCKGVGKELYVEVGEGTKKEVDYAPQEAIKDAMNEAGSAMGFKRLVINFLGGDDLIMMEVLDAATEFVLTLDVATDTKISFNSLCHKSIPSGACSVTVVGFAEEAAAGEAAAGEADSFAGVEKAVADGQVYFSGGSWWTTEESDINTAIE
jgi:hypothetical protein